MSKIVKIKVNPLHKWQKDAINLFDKHPENSIITIKSARQRGKTYTLMILSLRQCINNENNTTIIICPSFSACRKEYKDFVKAVGKIPVVKCANSSYFEIDFVNGSVLKFKSAEQRANLRGDTADLLIFDEGSFIDMETALECFNYVNTTDGNIVIASTPTFKDDNNLFYKYYKSALYGEANCYYIDFCEYDTTAMLSTERMELYKNTMPYNIFANEILGEFLTLKNSLWDFSKVLRNGTLPDGKLIAGIDFATGVNNDETAISVLNSQRQMVYLWHFNDKDTTETINFITNIIQQYHITKAVLEINSMGKTYKDLLKREVANKGIQCHLIDFYTSNSSKRDIIQNLQLNIQNETITLLDEQTLKLEFAGYEMKKTPSGVITYGNTSDRIHDDIVMATALALEGFKSGQYAVR